MLPQPGRPEAVPGGHLADPRVERRGGQHRAPRQGHVHQDRGAPALQSHAVERERPLVLGSESRFMLINVTTNFFFLLI